MQINAHYRSRYKVSCRLWVGSLKMRVEMYDKTRVDMVANQADKQKIWEVMQSCLAELYSASFTSCRSWMLVM